MTNRTIDHIVYSVPDLDIAIEQFEKATGVLPVFGGYHLTKGTKNALVNLGNQCYLEILAVDAQNTNIAPPRWMGIDLIQQPQVTRWCLKSTNLQRDSEQLQRINPLLGVINEGQRKTANGDQLAWEMILPLATPAVDVLPFMVDWKKSTVHPTDNLLPTVGLERIQLFHPLPVDQNEVLKNLEVEIVVNKASTAAIKVHLATPKGLVIL